MGFILYTALASIFILVAALGMAFYGDTVTFDIAQLGMKEFPMGLQVLAYAGFLIAFGVKLPIFPLHTWLPDAHIQFAPLLLILGVVNVVYGAFTAFGQTNLKRRLASSSISHMGFVLIGIASFTELGMNGAVLQMISHGLIAAAL